MDGPVQIAADYGSKNITSYFYSNMSQNTFRKWGGKVYFYYHTTPLSH